MSGRHDRTNAGSRVRASRSGVPAEGTDPRSAAAGQPAPGQPAHRQHGPSQYAPDQNAPGQHRPDRSDMSRNDAGRNGMSRGGAGQGGVSRAGAGDGVGMTDRSDAGASGGGDRELDPASDGPTIPMEAVARRTPTGWRVGDEEVPDLTSAMVLADLLAAELSAEEQAELDAGAAAPPPAVPRDAATHNTGQLGGVATPARPAARTRSWYRRSGCPGPRPSSGTRRPPGGGDPVRGGRRGAAPRGRAAQGNRRAARARPHRPGPGGAGHRDTRRAAPHPSAAGLRVAPVRVAGPRAADHGDGRPGDRQRDQPVAAPARGAGQATDAAPDAPAQPRRGLISRRPGSPVPGLAHGFAHAAIGLFASPLPLSGFRKTFWRCSPWAGNRAYRKMT